MADSAHLPLHYAPLPAGAQTVTLDGAEGAHAVRVRRTRVGERIRIADGAGEYADCTVVSVGPAELLARIEQRGHEPQPAPRIVVAQALPKGDRAALAVELLTECGADEIIPWQARNGVSRWADPAKAAKGIAKWQATAYAAAKQSRRPRIPAVSDAVDTAGLVARAATTRTLVLHESAAEPLEPAAVRSAREVLLVVGPEGGIAPDEIAALRGAGARSVRLGPQVLRTSTAGGVAAALVAALSGRWSAPS